MHPVAVAPTFDDDALGVCVETRAHKNGRHVCVRSLLSEKGMVGSKRVLFSYVSRDVREGCLCWGSATRMSWL